MLLSGEPDRWMGLLFAIFVVYSLTILILTERVGWPGEKLYFITSIMDVALITLATWMTMDKQSGFCFLYFLVVPFGTYVAGLVPGLSLAFVSSIFHLTIKAQYPETLSVNSALIETLILWALAITVGVAVKDVKSSRSKLLRMFDILNQRTSELEKSQAQIESIYETSRTLVEKLNLDEVVEEILNIVQKIMGYQFFTLFVLTEQRMLSLLGEIREGKKVTNGELRPRRLDGILRTVVEKAKPSRIFDAARESDLKMDEKWIRSLMAVPLISRGNVIGVIDARSTKSGAFLDQDEKMFSILAGSAALAIENAQLHQKTEELTIVDDLTDLYNFRYFSRKLGAEVMRAERYHLPLSLIMLDIDWFKRCNDTYGHLFGNMVLKDLARRTRDSVREVDVVCRYGGEEFAVILPQTRKADAQMIGERIRRSVESADFVSEFKDARVKITVSLGIASFPENGRTVKELIERVDQALYLAKGRGKNLVCTI
jgi:diguanylate cyclase (GGDEF)-like protein